MVALLNNHFQRHRDEVKTLREKAEEVINISHELQRSTTNRVVNGFAYISTSQTSLYFREYATDSETAKQERLLEGKFDTLTQVYFPSAREAERIFSAKRLEIAGKMYDMVKVAYQSDTPVEIEEESTSKVVGDLFTHRLEMVKFIIGNLELARASSSGEDLPARIRQFRADFLLQVRSSRLLRAFTKGAAK